MRGSGNWQRRLTFGGRIPWAVGLLLSVTLVLSLTAALGSRYLGPLFDAMALQPAAVWHGQLWRLVTWPFVEPSPIGLIFACLTLYWFAPQLAQRWGSPRLLRMVGGIILVAAVGSCLVGLVDEEIMSASYLGSWTISAGLVVVWGLSFPDQVVRIYLVLPIRGYWLAWGTVAITLVFAIYSGWTRLLPEMLAEVAALCWFHRTLLRARWARVRGSLGGSGRRVGRFRHRGVVIDFTTGDRSRGNGSSADRDREPN
jgi:membrane associated rhomboid family serine protease